MARSAHRRSIFAQKLDRVAFTSYFLGAIVPLIAFTFVVERYVLPVEGDTRVSVGFIAGVVSIVILTLGSFLVLRRTARQSLRQMDGDNARLQSLLDASQHLSAAEDGETVAAMSARCAFDVTGGRAALVLTRTEPGAPLQVIQTAGDGAEKLFEKNQGALQETANLALSQGRPVIRGAADGRREIAAAAVPIPGDVGSLGALVVAGARGAAQLEPSQIDSLSMLAGLASVAFRHADLRDAQRNFFTHVTDILVSALDAHLGYHTGHPYRVAQLSNRIGREMGLDEHRLERLHFAALLHDIGMLKLDRAFQKNPRTCRKHAELGYRMLQRIRLWQDLAPLVHHHHEWYDGSGYPAGLAGDAIPLGSRIIGLCEAFDTMTSEKSYKEPLTWEDALREVRRCAGSQFDPGVAQALLALVERGEVEPTGGAPD
jgi:putative nucleotidyltransferase with HDIG domain